MGVGLVSMMMLVQLCELEYGVWYDSWCFDGLYGDISLLILDVFVLLVLDWYWLVKIFVEIKYFV